MPLTIRKREASILVALLLVGVVGVTTIHIIFQDQLTKPLSDLFQEMKEDGLYEASAMILALVGFGSIIGVRISSDRTLATTQVSGLILVFGSSSVVIITQVLIMIGVCCFDLTQLTYITYLWITCLALIIMMFGYTLLITQQREEDKADRKFKREMNIGAEDLATGPEPASDTSTTSDT